MSRTDKDAPYWVRAEWYKPYHSKFCEAQYPPRYFATTSCAHRLPCNLPAEPARGGGVRDIGWYNRHECVWEPVWEFLETHYPGGPSKWERQHLEEMARQRIRNQVRTCIKEYNANGEVDTVPNVVRIPEYWYWW